MTGDNVALICTVIGAVVVVIGLLITLNDRRKKAVADDQDERRRDLQEAWNKGWASRNDEVSLLNVRYEDVKHDRDRLERRVDVLEGRVIEVGRIERSYPQLPPSTGDQ